MKKWEKVSYKIKTNGVSLKEIANEIYTIPSNQDTVRNVKYDASNIFLETTESFEGLKHKLEREFDIELEINY